MRVLYLVYTPYSGRASTTVPTEGWFRFLRPRGLEPIVASHRAGMFHAWAQEQGVPAYEVQLPFPSKTKPWPFLRSLYKLRRIVKRHGVQLIHCNEHEIYPIGQYLGRVCRLPVVVSMHFTVDRPFCQWAFRGPRRPDRVFFLSKGSREASRRSVEGFVPESNWRLLYNGLDLEDFQCSTERRADFRQQHQLNGHTAIGVACAIRPRKQLEHLFAAVEHLSIPNVRVVVAGGPVPGDEAYAEKLLQDGKQRLGDRLICLGYMNELRGFYNGLDLFVNTSQEEACSISIMEALACGCPVLGYPSTSVDEQVLPGGGEIVHQNDVHELSDALSRWLSDPSMLATARPRARNRAEECFDIRKISDQLWAEYSTLVS